MLSRGAAERQRDDEGRSLGRRLGPHASVMRLHDSLRDGEPEPRSLSFRSLGSPIAIEDVREISAAMPRPLSAIVTESARRAPVRTV